MIPPPTNGSAGGQLTIGTGVVADQTPLQHQARTNYASASLIRVKYHIEECEEEK